MKCVTSMPEILHVMIATKRMCGSKVLHRVQWHSLAKLCTKNYENPFIFAKVPAIKSVAPFLFGHGAHKMRRYTLRCKHQKTKIDIL